jgi:F-type H+-transporting ATPase subunit epsilon
MATTFRCRIVTPSAEIFDGQATYVTLPAWDGQMGVMASRAPVLAKLGTGSMRVDLASGSSRWFLLREGFVQMESGDLTLLADGAETAEEIDATTAEKSLAAANAELMRSGERPRSPEATEEIAGRQRLAMARLALVRHRGGNR